MRERARAAAYFSTSEQAATAEGIDALVRQVYAAEMAYRACKARNDAARAEGGR